MYGLCRLLIPIKEKTVEREGLGADYAMIRELHVYGKVAALKKSKDAPAVRPTDGTTQHHGVGRSLMDCAEDIVSRCGYEKLSVISGVGVRGYYEKLGYVLEGTYMVKSV